MLVAIYKDEPPRRDAVQKACDGCRATKQKVRSSCSSFDPALSSGMSTLTVYHAFHLST